MSGESRKVEYLESVRRIEPVSSKRKDMHKPTTTKYPLKLKSGFSVDDEKPVGIFSHVNRLGGKLHDFDEEQPR